MKISEEKLRQIIKSQIVKETTLPIGQEIERKFRASLWELAEMYVNMYDYDEVSDLFHQFVSSEADSVIKQMI